MRPKSLTLGRLFAAANVLAFSGMLASKVPEYEKLKTRDEVFWKTGQLEWTSADPMHLAGRPFYSSAHTSVPLIEDIYFIANTPAMLATLSVGYELGKVTSELWTGSPRTSSAWLSWALATTFAVFGAVWAFMLGAMIDWWRSAA